jgi:exonuclease III
MNNENAFEMTEVELVDFNLSLFCVYRTVVFNVQTKGMKLILCGDWNINFSQDSAHY